MRICARVGANWVDPPERKRKRLVNYNEGEFYRNAQKAAGAKAPTGPRLAKMPQMQVLASSGLGRAGGNCLAIVPIAGTRDLSCGQSPSVMRCVLEHLR